MTYPRMWNKFNLHINPFASWNLEWGWWMAVNDEHNSKPSRLFAFKYNKFHLFRFRIGIHSCWNGYILVTIIFCVAVSMEYPTSYVPTIYEMFYICPLLVKECQMYKSNTAYEVRNIWKKSNLVCLIESLWFWSACEM